MNVKTGACRSTKTDCRVLDDSSVKYSWTDSMQQTCLETRLDAGRNSDVTGRLDTSPVVMATAAAAGWLIGV